jgi:hypothetical protein
MATSYGAVPTDEGGSSGFTKSKGCHDVLFAVAFLAHLGLVVTSWLTYEPTDTTVDYMDRGVWKYVGTVTATALLLSTVALGFMTYFSDELVEIALLASCGMTFGVAAYAVYVWKIWMMVVGGVAFLSALTFTCLVWKRIPVRTLCKPHTL